MITAWTSLAALYVALTRGRDANTAHVTTVTQVQDATQGGDAHAVHRHPIAVLAGVLAERDVDPTRSAVAVATESAADPDAVVTAEEWLTAHRASNAVEEQHVAITETDLADHLHDLVDTLDLEAGRGRNTDRGAYTVVGTDQTAEDGVNSAAAARVADLREIAAAEPPRVAEDVVRVPTAAQTADAVIRAERALAESAPARLTNSSKPSENARPKWPAGTMTTRSSGTLPTRTGATSTTRAATAPSTRCSNGGRDPLTPTRTMLDQIGTAVREPLRVQEFGLDQLLVCADLALTD